jgi:NTE family protein
MRQIAPVSPALHLGADRVIVVGTAKLRSERPSARAATSTRRSRRSPAT